MTPKTRVVGIRGFKVVKDESRKHKNVEIILPHRVSQFSAGYDIYSNETVTLKPLERYVFWTDIKTYMGKHEVLMVHIRSSIGIKKGLMLANSTGIIDRDYFENESNDGNIGICLINLSGEEQNVEKGERIAQGIFTEYGVADWDKEEKERKGGIGSTN